MRRLRGLRGASCIPLVCPARPGGGRADRAPRSAAQPGSPGRPGWPRFRTRCRHCCRQPALFGIRPGSGFAARVRASGVRGRGPAPNPPLVRHPIVVTEVTEATGSVTSVIGFRYPQFLAANSRATAGESSRVYFAQIARSAPCRRSPDGQCGCSHAAQVV